MNNSIVKYIAQDDPRANHSSVLKPQEKTHDPSYNPISDKSEH